MSSVFGAAWSGEAPIVKVEFSAEGEDWEEAKLLRFRLAAFWWVELVRSD